MIPFASQRGGGQDLATHLLNAHENENVNVFQIRGAISEDLHGAFREWEIQAQSLTRCREYLYSMSINPDPAQGPLTHQQFMDYIERAEDALGLAGQPRAIVFHEKFGREHCHVVWSRVDLENSRAMHLAYDHDKLMRVTRAFARDHGLSLPEGYDKSRQVGQVTLYESDQARKTGFTKDDHVREVTEAWQQHDEPNAFVQGLADRGYILATGRRPYVVIDFYGGMHSLSKLIADKSVTTTHLRKFLSQEFPPESLPSVEEVQALVRNHRASIETAVDHEQISTEQARLAEAQDERRQGSEKARKNLRAEYDQQRIVQQAQHRAARDNLRVRYRQELRAIRQRRRQDQPTGLAAFLGRITGITLILTIRARRADARIVEAYRAERTELGQQQALERDALALRQGMRLRAVDRRLKTWNKVDAREQRALEREALAEQRIRVREDQGMPSLAALQRQHRAGEAKEALPAFNRASNTRAFIVPEVSQAFRAATGDALQLRQNSEAGDALAKEGQSHQRHPDKDQDRS